MRQALLLISCLAIGAPAAAVTYRTPPQPLVELVLAKHLPAVQFDSKLEWALLIQPEGPPPIASLARRTLSLASLQIDPGNFASPLDAPASEVRLKHLPTGREFAIQGLPEPLRASHFAFSPGERKVAFIQTREDSVELYVIDVAGKKAARVNRRPLHTIFGKYEWVDDDTLLYLAVVATPDQAPTAQLVSAGPQVKEHVGAAAFVPAVEAKDTLESAYARELFEFYATAQPMLNRGGVESKVGSADVYAELKLSPDRRHLLGRVLVKPFPHATAHYSMPCDIAVTQLSNGSRRSIARLRTPAEAASAPSFDWRSDQPATLYWSGGTSLYTLAAPFDTDARQLFQTTNPSRVVWSDGQTAWVSEEVRRENLVRSYRLNPSTGELTALLAEPRARRSTPLKTRNAFGREVLARIGAKVLVWTPGTRTISTVDIATGERAVVATDMSIDRIVSAADMTVLTSRVEEAAHAYFVQSLAQPSKPRTILRIQDTSPRASVRMKSVRYTRADGVPLSGVLFLAQDYDPQRDGRLPVFLWSYPRRYDSADAIEHEEPTGAIPDPWHFEKPYNWVTQGFAAFEVNMPIVPTDGHANGNDTLTQQLCMNAQAAIDKLVELGVGDRNRVAVGGHSYGAFMTVNLLAHCGSLFKAGIAMSGSYNQTLTPFGFQDETRTFWQASQLYDAVSPLRYADRIKTPLLLVHGQADAHPGTQPLNSELLFDAIKGNGGFVRYVALPYEDHGYRARESLLHLQWEMHQWLERYVK